MSHPTFETAKKSHKSLALLDDHLALNLRERLADVSRKEFGRALWVGPLPPDLPKTFGHFEAREDLTEGEIEHFPHEPDSLDLVVVAGLLHRVNDLPGVLLQIRRALKPDGLFLCALVGGETLHELRSSLLRVEPALRGGLSPRVHPMVDLQTFSGLLQRAGFALPVSDSSIKTVYYRQFLTLLRDIKATGEGLALTTRSKAYVGRNFWPSIAADYARHNTGADGLLRASVEVIYGIGWAPAETQQKPLKPGSAQHRLADALGAAEATLPDRARP